jgi:hypothetical protein
LTRKTGRTQDCDSVQARARLDDARMQFELAALAHAGSPADERKAAAASAVLAGIAASDAACCASLGRRSRSQDHRDAADLLRQIEPGGDGIAKQFGRLIALKDAAQYGFEEISGQTLTALQRQAKALVQFAEDVLAR